MTPEKLAEIRACAKDVATWPHSDELRRRLAAEYVPALIAEVERLRGELTALRSQKGAEQ